MANTISFNNAEETKKVAQEVTEKIGKSVYDKKQLFTTLMEDLNNLTVADENFSELGVLLNLDEDQFRFVAPIFLDEMEKSFNNVNDNLALVQALNAAGMTAEDLRDQNKELLDQLDKETEPFLSLQKRNFLRQMLNIVYNSIAETEGVTKRFVKIPIEFCHPNAKMPAYAHPSDAGMDVYALEDITIAPGETKLIPIGIKVALPLGYELQVRPKSGRSLHSKLRIANTPGTIDAGYRDEIGVIIDNIDPPIKAITGIHHSFGTAGSKNGGLTDIYEPICEYGSSYTIGAGEKFAQLVLSTVPKAVFEEVSSVADIGENRGGGYGSTGVK